jgi:hypothetical protein
MITLSLPEPEQEGDPMGYGFEHHYEAQIHAAAVSDPRARVALGIVHHLLLEAAGMNLHSLPERYSPIQTLDVLYFYKTVERLFAEWTEEIRNDSQVPSNREHLLQLQEVTALIPTLPTERARVGLYNYLSILRNTPVPEGTFVDALFCSRLVVVLLSQPELLERILSGDESWATINPWEGILD